MTKHKLYLLECATTLLNHPPEPTEPRVLEIGSGNDSTASQRFAQLGYKVTVVDPTGRGKTEHPLIEYRQDFWPINVRPQDAIWASHVLEHQRNPGAFLDACWSALRPQGWLFVIVPPLKHEIVGGHLTLWNMGLLWYHLILAGFDVRNGHFIQHGYNIAAFVRAARCRPPVNCLSHDRGDIEALQDAGCWPIYVKHGFNGQILKHNWEF